MFTGREQLLRELASYQECQTEIRSAAGKLDTEAMITARSPTRRAVIRRAVGFFTVLFSDAAVRWGLRRTHG